MFHDIPENMRARMRYLEARDTRDRQDGTPHMQRMRQITPDTGRFLALMAATAPAGRVIEIGSSAGYSTLWLALACRARGRTLTTFEIMDEKVALARETFALAGVEDVVELVHGDARDYLGDVRDVAFCFLDANKDVYPESFDLVVPNLVTGGLLVADNAISHADVLGPLVERALADPRLDGMVVPVGRGELLCRKI